jgi:hypothetical protein
MAQLGNTPLNFRATHTSNYQTSGKTHGGTLADLIQNPKVGNAETDDLHLAMEYLGAPPRIPPDALDNFPRDSEAIASAYVGPSKAIEQIVVRGSVANMAIRHFSLLPPRECAEDEIQGMQVNILRLENTLPDMMPEGTAPRNVTHTYEKVFMRHNRWGIGMQIVHDFYRTADGRQLFLEQTGLLAMNMVILAQLTITSCLIRAKDYYRRWRIYFSQEGSGTSMGWSDMDMRFAALNKKPKAWYLLSNWAKRMAQKSGNGGFTAALHAETLKEQIIYGSEFETEAHRRGPKGPQNLEQGTDAIRRTPDGIELIEEPAYLLQNVGQQGDEATQLLVSAVQVGRVGYVNPLDPIMRGTWKYHNLNFDKGNVEICIQEYEDLLNAALCFDEDGELDGHCYNALTQGDKAESFARNNLGIQSLAPTSDPDDVPMIDPFIASVDGVHHKVLFQGNQDLRHCTFKTQCQIVQCALEKLREKCDYDGDMKLVREMLDLANRNYHVAIDGAGDVEAFIWATANANGGNTLADQRAAIPSSQGPDFVNANEWGSPNLPGLVEVPNFPGGGTGYFVGVDEQHPVYKVVVETGTGAAHGLSNDPEADQMRAEHGGVGVIGGIDAELDAAGNVIADGQVMSTIPYDVNGRPLVGIGGAEGMRRRLQGMFPSYVSLPGTPETDAPYHLVTNTLVAHGPSVEDAIVTGMGNINGAFIAGLSAQSADALRLAASTRANAALPDDDAVAAAISGNVNAFLAYIRDPASVAAMDAFRQAQGGGAYNGVRSTARLQAGLNAAVRSVGFLGNPGIDAGFNVGVAGNAFRASLVAVTTGGSSSALGGIRGALPGFSNISHMRYLANAYRLGTAGNWVKIPEYEESFRKISEGMYALDRVTDFIKNAWSLPDRPNLFFDERNMPYYQIPRDEHLRGLTTFQQDAVQGVRYGIGIQASGSYSISLAGGAGDLSGTLSVVRQGGIPPGFAGDVPAYRGVWRTALNYSLANQQGGRSRPPASERLQSGAPRNSVGTNALTYPGSGLEWMVQMGFAADPQPIGAGFNANAEQRAQGEQGVGAFLYGQFEGPLLVQMQTGRGVAEWIRRYEASGASAPENTGLADSTWGSMAREVSRLIQMTSGWQNNGNRERGGMLARVVTGITFVVESYKEESSANLKLRGKALNDMIGFATKMDFRKKFVASDGRLAQDGVDTRADLQTTADRLIKALYGPNAQPESFSPRYLHSRLSLAPDYWKSVGARVAQVLGIQDQNIGSTLSILRPYDPDAPNSRLLGLTPDFALVLDFLATRAPPGAAPPRGQADAENFLADPNNARTLGVFADEIAQHARGRPQFSIKASMLDPVMRRMAEAPVGGSGDMGSYAGGRAEKRTRFSDSGSRSGGRDEMEVDDDDLLPQRAGGRFFYVPPSRPSARDEPEYGRWYKDAVKGAHGEPHTYGTTAMHELAPGPHYAQMHTFEHAIPGASNFAPNSHFTDRWNRVMAECAYDLPRRMMHLAFLGLPIHARSFSNLKRCGIPPPITLLPADPFIEFRMTSMIFVKAGAETGFLSYFLKDLTVSYNGSYKILYANLTAWFGAMVKIIENVLVVDHVSFDRYLRGADGSLVRSVYTQGKNNPTEDRIDFDINAPGDRKRHRFVLYAGASYSDNEVPDPLPLTGSYRTGNYAGLGVFISNQDVGRTRSGAAYPSAVLVNYKTGFWMLNQGIGNVDDDQAPFEKRVDVASRAHNLLLSRANQWGMNLATNDYKRRIKNGTGPLGVLCEGIGYIFNGSPGTISEVLERVEGK